MKINNNALSQYEPYTNLHPLFSFDINIWSRYIILFQNGFNVKPLQINKQIHIRTYNIAIRLVFIIIFILYFYISVFGSYQITIHSFHLNKPHTRNEKEKWVSIFT